MTEEKIRKLAEQIGIDLIGFFSTEPLTECLPYLIKRDEAGFSTGFEGGPPQERINYQKQFPPAKAGIAIGISNYQKLEIPDDKKVRGKLASVSWGADYHQVVKFRMNQLMNAINSEQVKNQKPLINYKLFVDNSPLVDRGSAYRAGLGFFGKNNCLINDKLGSFFFIGQILVDSEILFAPLAPIENSCKKCRRCLDACPNGALGEGFSLNPSKCISYLTQKKVLLPEEESRITTYLYGCDICQQVCPYNQNLPETSEESFWINAETANPPIDEILKLSNKSFKIQFGKTASGWRGKNVLMQNAQLIKKNKLKND
ncbi:MAG: tRNA epoxyqueuosine(34) reductase QueG [Acetobacterium woodii]|nr:tRNA epoxyqueuosine(34) reductase QueG [Acetobacterium woodii]